MSPDRVIIPRSLPAARHGGFTIVELMVVVAIVGILAAVAIPNFSSYMARQRIKDQTSAFMRSLNLARSEAIKRGRPVSMCRSDTPEATAPACDGNGGDWATGWLVFEDNNGNNTIDNDDTVVRIQPGWTNSGGITRTDGNNLLFRPDGLNRSLAQTFIFKPKVEGAAPPVSLILNFTGRVRQE